MTPRGRRPGPSTTRREILDAARTLFGTHGFDRTTLRMIAEAAKVDPALVGRAFDGKQALLLSAVEWPWDPVSVVPRVAAGPRARAGYRMAKLVVDTWEDPDQRAPIVALLVSAAGSAEARRLLGEFITTQVQVPLVRACGFDHAELRGALIGAQNVGLCMARYVLEIEPLASLEAATLTDLVGAATQRLLTLTVPPSRTT
jgi:AcrR family transcriptional regulator